MSDKWLTDLGFEKCYNVNNKRYYIYHIIQPMRVEAEIHTAFGKIRQIMSDFIPIWIIVCKYLNGKYIMYQATIDSGQGRLDFSGALNKENMQKKLEELVKRLKSNLPT